ncbi:RCC1 domain-containing protein [Pendulispora albinea]|uniref:Uncharacterized protein n=1 Tax=Pendulispora albinea TaxID=2741071 RepID=A0ABZ2M3A1_9BACT
MSNTQSSLFAVFAFALGACITNSEVGKFHDAKEGAPGAGGAGEPPPIPLDTGAGADGGPGSNPEPNPTPLFGFGPNRLAAGSTSTCVLTEKGQVLCWGDNGHGQLGIGDAKIATSAEPLQVRGLDIGIDAIFGGGFAHCALKKDRSAVCWGHSEFDNTGGNIVPYGIRYEPGRVAEFSEALSIAMGTYFQCAVTAEQNTKCSGSNTVGQTAEPTTIPFGKRDAPKRARPARAVAAAQGGYFACAITTSDELKCWGANVYGQLGDGTNANSSEPVGVSGLDANVSTVTAGSDHTCAIVSGTVRCWGRNNQGQLGLGTVDEKSHMRPQQVEKLPPGMVAVTAGEGHTCALSDRGAVYCWGNYRRDDHSWPPVEVISRDAVEIAAGTRHTCARLKNQRIRCWGDHDAKQLGIFEGQGSVLR